ncbi:5-oxoprolinase subunit PxpA [Sediminicola sp. 1XM1-17]|uniref:5-oxoprolinase subunit PxpA n=1 Tax=Sediminicola sp. 1XM1-17 TaxID=3127702 RepID=UPI0030776DCA
MEKDYIDINCDVGEGVGNEESLFPFISSCNIACGGHAGDEETMKRIVLLAKKEKVKIGAHPAYPDKENFGRVSLAIPSETLKSTILEQISKLMLILDGQGLELHHIKAHGALYNDIAKDETLASIFLDAVENFKESTFIFVPYRSVLEKEALKRGFKIMVEAFGDRNYNRDLSLASRSTPNALIQEPREVLEHMTNMVKNNKVVTVQGTTENMEAETFCIHGDTPTALQILVYLSKELPNKQIYLKK